MDAAERVANAVLYEGYILYPYRASSGKNQHRWGFGVLYPMGYTQSVDASNRSELVAECVLRARPEARVALSLRFLQLVPADGPGRSSGQEAIERRVEIPATALGQSVTRTFEFTPGTLRGVLLLSSTPIADGAHRITVRVCNRTGFVPPAGGDHRTVHDAAMAHALASAHVLATVEHGAFVSSQDPPDSMRDLVAGCRNEGVWPVMLGDPSRADAVLFSPIVLEDYPRVAPESPGDLFDATEIDEILTLRLLTLTDDEKQAVRAGDPRARALLERAESMSAGELAALHGARRSERTARDVNGVEISRGDRVRIRPVGRADVMDVALRGMSARVSSFEQDFEGRVFACVVIEDDPGRDLGEAGMPGHRFFFRPEELEALR